MDPFTAFLAVAAVVSVFATVQQTQAASTAAKAQKNSNELSRQQQIIQQTNERRTQISQARIKQAQIIQGSVNSGVSSGSSAIQGSTGSLSSQLNNNIGFLDTSESLSNQATVFNNKAADAQASGALWAGIGSIANTGLTAGLNYKAGADKLPAPSATEDVG